MKAIYSLQIGNNLDEGNFCGYRNPAELFDSLLLSSIVAKKYFDSVLLYTDSEGARLLKKDGRKFPFEHVIICLDFLKDVHKYNWALSKIYVYQLQQEPFVHIDIDAFLWDGLPATGKKFIFQQKEPANTYKFYNEAFAAAKEAGLVNFDQPPFALNTSIFGVLEVEGLKILPDYYTLAREYTNKNVKFIDQLTQNIKWAQCVLFEQMFLVHILKEHGYKLSDIETILNHDTTEKHTGYRFTHLIVNAKRNEEHIQWIKRQLQLYDQKKALAI